MNKPRKALIYNACACMFAVSAMLKCCVAGCSVRCLGVVMGCMQRGISVVKVLGVCVRMVECIGGALFGCWCSGEQLRLLFGGGLGWWVGVCDMVFDS